MITAFVGVNVVPMDAERILENQTVIVRDGRITEIGAAGKIKIPAGATQIDGRGKFLIPGLADMHGHLAPGEGTLKDGAGQQLALFLANGVTTVRNMIGSPAHVVLRDKIARGEIPAPTLFTAGPPILGKDAASPEAAAQIVSAQKQAGFDLLKVHEGLTPEVYEAIVAQARKVGIPFAGHVTASVGLRRALNARQNTIEHLDGYLQALGASDSPVEPPASQVVLGPFLNHIDENKIEQLARATKEAGVYNNPTLTLFKLVVSTEKPEDYLKWQEMQYIPAKMRENFAKQKAGTANMPAPVAERQRFVELRNKMLRALHKAGAKLLIGPDSPQFFLVPGFATHREMQSFVEAGLSPYATLEAATRNAAENLGVAKEVGTVEVGKRADLVLLDANPLQSIANAQKISGVMVRGRWLPKTELDKTLAEIAAVHKDTAK